MANALRMRALFHRLPNGQYGLLTWYPNAKSQRASDDDDDGEDETEGESTKPAANEESAAGPVSSDAPLNDQEEGASEPQEQEA